MATKPETVGVRYTRENGQTYGIDYRMLNVIQQKLGFNIELGY